MRQEVGTGGGHTGGGKVHSTGVHILELNVWVWSKQGAEHWKLMGMLELKKNNCYCSKC